jgi:hypothetical protein
MALIASALGHWIYYSDDPGLSDLVILKPDWLSTAISLVLDDPDTERAHGLVPHRHLPRLWNDPARSNRYPPHLYPAFLQLMEKFDISYRIPDRPDGVEPTSLVAQLVPVARPDLAPWFAYEPELETRTQVCEVLDAATGDPTVPEGLMYQLIVRLHSFSLGRRDYASSVHWQGGVVLDDDYNGRALLTIQHNLISVQVRAAYPQFLLHRITQDVRRHIETFWRGLEVRVMVPCQANCGRDTPGAGLFDISHLMASRAEGHSSYPCSRCAKWLDIDGLLVGSEPATIDRDHLVRAFQDAISPHLIELQNVIEEQGVLTLRAVDEIGFDTRRALSQAEERYRNLILALDDEAREGPRLISLTLLHPSLLRGGLTKHKVQVTLWCEHSRLPVHLLNKGGRRSGIYEIDVPREWLVKAAPWIRATSVVIRSLLPVGLSTLNVDVSNIALVDLNKAMLAAEAELESLPGVSEGPQRYASSPAEREAGVDGSLLRSLHSFLRQKDPSYGGLERVRVRDRYLWVHPRFVDLYRLPPPEIPTDSNETWPP